MATVNMLRPDTPMWMHYAPDFSTYSYENRAPFEHTYLPPSGSGQPAVIVYGGDETTPTGGAVTKLVFYFTTKPQVNWISPTRSARSPTSTSPWTNWW